MLTGLTILIAEDQALVALDLAEAVEEQGGVVAGPAPTVAEGLQFAERALVAGAILDANLLDGDVTPLALRLIERGIPFVIHTGTGLPEELAEAHPDLTVIMKPVPAPLVLEALTIEIAKRSDPAIVAQQETIRVNCPPPGAPD